VSYPPLGSFGPRAIAWWALRTQVDSLRVLGAEHVPAAGPTMIVARHYHHLLDGSVIVARVSRPVHIVVGLDWARNARERRIMEWACRAADWPIVLRRATFDAPAADRPSAYAPRELFRYTRRAIREATRLLRAGRVVAIFPEAFPTIDPAATPRRAPGQRPSFERGFATMLAQAEADGHTRIAVVPLGFSYQPTGAKWSITARFGPAMTSRAASDVEAVIASLSRNSEAPAV